MTLRAWVGSLTAGQHKEIVKHAQQQARPAVQLDTEGIN